MTKIIGSFFGGGDSRPKVVKQEPIENEAEKAKAENRRRLATAYGFNRTVLGSMYQAAGQGKERLGD